MMWFFVVSKNKDCIREEFQLEYTSLLYILQVYSDLIEIKASLDGSTF